MSIFKRFSKRVTILAVLGSLLVVGSALAYFTSQATGGGQAAATNGNGGTAQVGVAGYTDGGVLMPDGVSHAIKFTLAGNATKTVKVQNITQSGPLTSDPGHPACTAQLAAHPGWYVITGVTGLNQELAAGSSVLATKEGSITMPVNTTDNQDACQDAGIFFNFTVS
jgi:hypothetical protein